MSAQFWVWSVQHDAWIMIRLTDQHTEESPFVLRDVGGPCDEGHSRTVETFWLDEDGVHSLDHSRGSDCDGPYEYNRELVCPLDKLATVPCAEVVESGEMREIPGMLRPDWHTVSESQRDYFAEAMGC